MSAPLLHESSDWNPRFVAYARSNDYTPEQQLEADTARYPGGKMSGFVLWLDEMWRLWRAETNTSSIQLNDAQHDQFDAWLIARPSSEFEVAS